MSKKENEMPLIVTGYDLVNVDGNRGWHHKNSRCNCKHVNLKFLHKMDTGFLEICHQS